MKENKKKSQTKTVKRKERKTQHIFFDFEFEYPK